MGESFDLPLGVIKDGAVNTEVTLIPMTAGMRRALASRTSQKNPARALTDMLGKCCESIGGESPTPQLINSLPTGDRDFMLLMIRQLSLGDTISTQMTCGTCASEIVFDLSINEMPIRRVEKDKHYILEGNFAVLDLSNDDLKLKVKMRLATGFDQIAISDKIRSDPVLASYELYARLIRTWVDGDVEEATPNTLDFIDNLPLQKLNWLEEAYRKAQPGPSWTTRVECSVCGSRTMLDMGDSDFLFKTPR